MNIVHICNVGESPNGIKTVLKKLSFEQIKLGNRVRVFSLRKGEPEFDHIKSVSNFYKKIHNDKPDVVIFHSLYHFMYIPFYAILSLCKIPYMIELHGTLSYENYKVNHLKKYIANIMCFNHFVKKASCIIYLNQNEYENSFAKTINPQYLIIPNGCDTMDLSDKKTPNMPIKFIFIGRLDPFHKGLDILFKAIELVALSELRNNVKFLFYGSVYDSHIEWIDSYFSKIGSIAEFKGPVYAKQKDEAIRDADIFILTSRYEGMPMGVLEALSYGLPCILTSETNMGEEVASVNAGWLTELTPVAIASTIHEAVSKYLLEYQCLKQNSLSLSKKYNWSKIAEESVDKYLTMLGRIN